MSQDRTLTYPGFQLVAGHLFKKFLQQVVTYPSMTSKSWSLSYIEHGSNWSFSIHHSEDMLQTYFEGKRI